MPRNKTNASDGSAVQIKNITWIECVISKKKKDYPNLFLEVSSKATGGIRVAAQKGKRRNARRKFLKKVLSTPLNFGFNGISDFNSTTKSQSQKVSSTNITKSRGNFSKVPALNLKRSQPSKTSDRTMNQFSKTSNRRIKGKGAKQKFKARSKKDPLFKTSIASICKKLKRGLLNHMTFRRLRHNCLVEQVRNSGAYFVEKLAFPIPFISTIRWFKT